MKIPENIERIAYSLVTFGITADHLTTRIGLMNPMIREFNPFTVLLHQRSLWVPFDLFMLSMALGLPALIIRTLKIRQRKIILLFPLLFGAARLGAALHNFALILYFS
ncbi:MAG: hypothetical protein JSV27_09225 [Candidatus Bathyarchaeota archaeon]|nr:MAG: hypothetical protein JSV27_09225 [Candidatus Bathyarchaeota archaeon]